MAFRASARNLLICLQKADLRIYVVSKTGISVADCQVNTISEHTVVYCCTAVFSLRIGRVTHRIILAIRVTSSGIGTTLSTCVDPRMSLKCHLLIRT